MAAPQSTPIYRKNNISAGLLIDRPDTPQPGDQFLTTDTEQYFVCYELGVWQVASPLTADESGYLNFNGSPVFLPGETTIFNFATALYRLMESVSFLEISGSANRTHVLSTASTAAELTPDNILSAATSGKGVLLSCNKLLTAGTTVYGYYRDSSNETLDSIYANTRTLLPIISSRSSNVRMTTIKLVQTVIE